MTVVLGVMLSACASLADRQAAGPQLTQAAGWQWGVLSAGPFDVAVARSPVTDGAVLTVYLEGDGFAFVHPHQPSIDPTPTDPVALRLALAHPAHEAVAWLGRPCQYTMPDHGRNCDVRYWTNRRYAPEVIGSLAVALDKLKEQTKASRLVLVGYSGGGALAVLLAAQRADVDAVITVVADLDLGYWTARDGLSPLTGSVDPASVAPLLGHLPQYHLTGGKDKTVGTDVAESFVRHLPVGTPVVIHEVPNFTHGCCWQQDWKSLMQDARRQVANVDKN